MKKIIVQIINIALTVISFNVLADPIPIFLGGRELKERDGMVIPLKVLNRNSSYTINCEFVDSNYNAKDRNHGEVSLTWSYKLPSEGIVYNNSGIISKPNCMIDGSTTCFFPLRYSFQRLAIQHLRISDDIPWAEITITNRSYLGKLAGWCFAVQEVN